MALHVYETVWSLTTETSETEYEVRVSGEFLRGYRATFWGDHPEPGEPDRFTIDRIDFRASNGDEWRPWPVEPLTEAHREAIEAEAIADYHAWCDDQEVQRAEARREERNATVAEPLRGIVNAWSEGVDQ